MRRPPEVRVDELKGMPIDAALGGCRRAVFLGLFLILSLVMMALFAGGPILQILLSIFLAR